MKDQTQTVTGDTPVIVGIGASAGGLEAFQDLFSRLQDGHQLALVLVQHLDPHHESLLPELLSKRIKSPVHAITDGMRAEAGSIYLIPPAKEVEVEDGILKLIEFETPRGQRRPIDTFFKSLAKDRGDRAVGIVLSGTGSDGSDGVKAIKEAGGLIFAQDPAQAKYDGMPKSAIATGAVDLTLETSEMVEVLDDFFDRQDGIEPELQNNTEFLDKVFRHVRYQTGHDFAHYKKTTLLRRLTVRMSVLGMNSPSEYLKRLIHDRQEASRLIRDVLINVTSFFRDEEIWNALRDQVIAEILKDRGRDEEVRIWVPGCSTGQEAYTIAMLVLEELKRTDSNPEVVIFGTDIDDEALQVARLGRYPNSIADEVPEGFIQSYFEATSDGYEVGKTLRSLVRFSNQSLIKDPPFSKLDFVSCRNVLIYFEKKLQDVSMQVFHYALKPNAFLMLGLSETTHELQEHFETVDSQNRIYRRNDDPSRPLNLPLGRLSTGRRSADRRSDPDMTPPGQQRPVVEALLARHTAPYVTLNRNDRVIHASPGAERFLSFRSGDQTYSLTSMIDPALENVIKRFARRSGAEVPSTASAKFTGEVGGQAVNLRISHERLESGDQIIVFHDASNLDIEADVEVTASPENSDYVNELERDLDDARQTIRTTVEELETSNEELKSSNEEMMSMNEELQSANEELSTINEELQNKVTELNRANADLSSFIASTNMTTIFLDHHMRVRRATPQARKLLSLREAELGMALEDATAPFPVHDLLEACRQSEMSNSEAEIELDTRDGSRHFIARIVPNAAQSEDETSIVVTFIDVTELRDSADEVRLARGEALERLAEVNELYKVSPVAMALMDKDLRYIRVNQQLADINGVPLDAHVGARVQDVVPDLGDEVMEPVTQVFTTGVAILGQEVIGRTAARPSEDRAWIVDWYPLKRDGDVHAVGVNVRDVTDEKKMEAELHRVMRELQHRVKNMLSNVKALVNRAQRDKRGHKEVLNILAARIDSLAHTHSLLTAENWRSSRMVELLKPELHDVYGDEVLTVRGPDIRLNARASLALGLTIHELATNAAKYGALRETGGHLDLRWSRFDEGDGEVLRIVWKETCKDPVDAPDTEGFGTALIRSTINGTLEGTVDYGWEGDGLRCVIEIPYEQATRVSTDEGEQSSEEDNPVC